MGAEKGITVVEEDIGELGYRDLSSRYCCYELNIYFRNNNHRLAAEPSPWERSEDLNGYER